MDPLSKLLVEVLVKTNLIKNVNNMTPIFLAIPFDIPLKPSPASLIIGFLLGIALTYLLSWGILTWLGRKLVFKVGILLLALFMGVIGAFIGDDAARLINAL
jgi:hypothetical protein